MNVNWWTSVQGEKLAQGDLLEDCLMPVFNVLSANDPNEVQEQEAKLARLIVVTQSCDLENDKAEFVALCSAYRIPEFERTSPAFAKKGVWEQVRRGRIEGLHLLASPTAPDDNSQCFVVDFRRIVSLPVGYVTKHATGLGDRPRLQSPFVEHFSQSLARFFMRVGLPSQIPAFK
jgi:hypothetical protein